jgi:hypothetical protein
MRCARLAMRSTSTRLSLHVGRARPPWWTPVTSSRNRVRQCVHKQAIACGNFSSDGAAHIE